MENKNETKLTHLVLAFTEEMKSSVAAREILDDKIYSLGINKAVIVTEVGSEGSIHHHVILSDVDGKALFKTWDKGKRGMHPWGLSIKSHLEMLSEYLSKQHPQKKEERLAELEALVDALSA